MLSPPPGTAWNGQASQDELMHKDCCALVDERDNIVGHATKWDVHRFEGATPRGQLHRAFSAFLFDGDGRLLLQRRAASKITFPGVWTNTCCSHPLAGFTPSELDTAGEVLAGRAPGAARAAVRKLHHELGVPPAQMPLSAFKFLTRLHYCAPDTQTHGAHSPWGEHEMDYILCARLPNITLDPNPEEVSETRWVTQKELEQMMAPQSGLFWSPWFRIIAQRLLPRWWVRYHPRCGALRLVAWLTNARRRIWTSRSTATRLWTLLPYTPSCEVRASETSAGASVCAPAEGGQR